MKEYVICPSTITSPAPSEGFMAATGLGPNEPCGQRVQVYREAPVMAFVCPLGHRFTATEKDVRHG